MKTKHFQLNGDSVELLPELDVSVGLPALNAERDRIVTYLQRHPDGFDKLGGRLARTLAYIREAEARIEG
jgi:hypothetical protein